MVLHSITVASHSAPIGGRAMPEKCFCLTEVRLFTLVHVRGSFDLMCLPVVLQPDRIHRIVNVRSL